MEPIPTNNRICFSLVFETKAGRELVQKTLNGQPFMFMSIFEDEGNADLSRYQLGCIPASEYRPRRTVRKTEKKLGAMPEEIQQNLLKNQQNDGDI